MHTIKSARNATHVSEVMEVMTFTLGEQEYGIELRKVQELRSHDAVVQVRGEPAFIRGAINRYGTRVPLVDLRLAFGFDMPVPEPFSDIIVVNVGGRTISMAVDAVVDVVTLTATEVSAPPSDMSLPAGWLFGIGISDGRRLHLIDIDNVILDGAMAILDERAA